MTPFFLMVVGASAAVGMVAGAVAVPLLANAALKRAYRRSLKWWNDSLHGFKRFQMQHTGACPKPSAAGSEGALGIWLVDAQAQAKRKTLTHERAEALREAGVTLAPDASARSEREQARRCSFSPNALQRTALALACGVWFGALPACGLPVHLALPLGLCGIAMAAGVVCDVRARMIPLECCVCLLFAGAVFQLLNAGISGLVAGLVAAAAVLAVCWVANRIARGMGGSVGQGDVRCMVALAVASGPASLVGAAACYIAASVFSLGGLASRRLRRKDGIPMAPFLALWLAFGTVAVH